MPPARATPLVLSTTPIHQSTVLDSILAVVLEGAEHHDYGISPAAASAAASAAAAPVSAGTLLNSRSMTIMILSLSEIAILTFMVLLLCGIWAFPSGHTVKGCVVMEVLV